MESPQEVVEIELEFSHGVPQRCMLRKARHNPQNSHFYTFREKPQHVLRFFYIKVTVSHQFYLLPLKAERSVISSAYSMSPVWGSHFERRVIVIFFFGIFSVI